MKIKIGLLFGLLILSTPGYLQGADEDPRVSVYAGPRVGITGIITSREDFDDRVQLMYPDTGREYLPFITQFGFGLEQRMRLGSTSSHFAFQQIVTVGGLDQAIAIPAASFLIGFRSHAGLEVGLGPTAGVLYKKDEDVIEITGAVIYAVGWSFRFADVFIPITLAVVPQAIDGMRRVSLISGFNFRVR